METEPEAEVIAALTQEQVDAQIRARLASISQQFSNLAQLIQRLTPKPSVKLDLTASSRVHFPSAGTSSDTHVQTYIGFHFEFVLELLLKNSLNQKMTEP